MRPVLFLLKMGAYGIDETTAPACTRYTQKHDTSGCSLCHAIRKAFFDVRKPKFIIIVNVFVDDVFLSIRMIISGIIAFNGCPCL